MSFRVSTRFENTEDGAGEKGIEGDRIDKEEEEGEDEYDGEIVDKKELMMMMRKTIRK